MRRSDRIDDYTNNTGSVVGNAQAPFAEQKTVHGGLQAMPLDYKNITTPFYSEAELDFGTAQDWTANGVDTLVLYVQGSFVNSRSTLYVAAEDASKHLAAIVHPDPAVVTVAKWTEWKIPLSNFTGINLGKIRKLYLAVGNRAKLTKSGTGRIYIDDICLVKP